MGCRIARRGSGNTCVLRSGEVSCCDIFSLGRRAQKSIFLRLGTARLPIGSRICCKTWAVRSVQGPGILANGWLRSILDTSYILNTEFHGTLAFVKSGTNSYQKPSLKLAAFALAMASKPSPLSHHDPGLDPSGTSEGIRQFCFRTPKRSERRRTRSELLAQACPSTSSITCPPERASERPTSLQQQYILA